MYVHPDSCLVGLTRSCAPFFLNTGARSMADALIENPILNSPFVEPDRHFKFTDEGITNEIVDGRRSSSYFIPIARPKKKGKQLAFDTEWTQDRIEENKTVNRIRQRVGMWREGGYVGVTPTTAGLLRYWTDPERERKLFFCQIEALETLIYLTEVAHHCYRRKPEAAEAETLTGDDRKEAEKRAEEARIWISGIEAVKAKIGVKGIYDLSATPFFLKGSGYSEGTLFPWVVSDFSLIDAIEAGIVKVPRVPVSDDSMQGDQPPYRDLWLRIREHLPRKGRKTEELDELKGRRINEVAFLLAKLTIEKYFRQDGENRPEKTSVHKFDSEVQAWLFPQVLAITKRWLEDGYVHCKDHTFPQLSLLLEFAHDATDRIYGAIVRGSNGSPDGPPSLRPILRPYDTVGSTRYVDFDTTRPVYATRADRCHISHVVGDTDSWEQKMSQTLEEMSEVIRYVKNHNLGFTIPYTINGEEHQYQPDFIAVLDDGRGALDPLNLIVEVTGEKKKEKAAKVMTARMLWVPAVNNHGALGRWAFLEVTDPYDVLEPIRSFVSRSQISPHKGGT
jgi:hypothetical protein